MRIEQLTFTRFLAAISIVIFHYAKKSFLFNNKYVNFIFSNADVCVSYFFILSGFVMMVAYAKRTEISAKEYFINRFARIYPVYFLALLIMFLLQAHIQNLDVLGLVLNVFLIQAWVSGKILSVNPPGWSLSVEFIFYAIFPFLFNQGFRKMKLKRIFLYIILFWILSQIIFQLLYLGYIEIDKFAITRDFIMYNPLLHINEFLVGTLAGFLFTEKLKSRVGNYDFLILAFVVLIILALKFSMNLSFHNGLLAVFFIPLIILLSLNNGWITKLFQKKAFVFLGEISFGIYILQHPVFSVISSYSVKKYLHMTDMTMVFFLRLILLIITASVSYLYIEKPIQNLIKARRVKLLRV
ncbi:acyltransferase family protein [Flavobacterium sp. KACC 22763]|uniref:acyltransferase family protein n=1 Tax=Flavobacterium sp. KACC 22763 TaxID=3025668 RepID=UPI002366F28B|nr:acyltransferase [Flavobacterium sp. KACC 22763]WDF62869.1 acyltransferase [Flavobacterium sp. KACC 22763]